MTQAAEVRVIRQRLGLSQAEAGALLGCGINNLANWETGRRRTPALLLTVLRLLERRPALVHELQELPLQGMAGRERRLGL